MPKKNDTKVEVNMEKRLKFVVFTPHAFLITQT